MAELLTPLELEALAKSNGKSMAQVCRETNIAPSTFTRWKQGLHEPTLGIYRKLTQAAAKPVPCDTIGAIPQPSEAA